jgi:heme A synthase
MKLSVIFLYVIVLGLAAVVSGVNLHSVEAASIFSTLAFVMLIYWLYRFLEEGF